MMFLLHLPPEARSLLHSPLSKETCEFLMQVCFECSCDAVLVACSLKRRTSKEDFAKCFGGQPKADRPKEFMPPKNHDYTNVMEGLKN